LARLYGGPAINPDVIPETPQYDDSPIYFDAAKAISKANRGASGRPPELEHKSIDLGGGESIQVVRFGEPYWMASCEISNGQFRRFDPAHSSRYYGKRHEERGDDQGLPLNGDNQPAIRVSSDRAMAFCDWLSEKTGLKVTLPTEQQWEYACRGGSSGRFHYTGESFGDWENLADKTFATFGYTGKSLNGHFVVGGDVDYIMAEGVDLADRRFDDGGCVTMPVGSYKANAFGLHDMHGNAAEWTLSDFDETRKVVKGGSFLDRPERAGVDVRHGYAPWFNVHNVGFRVVVID
jgi:formylglycine-generating enzyme required for sulfatase activity